MYLAKIKQLLNEKIGLNPDSVGESSIVRAVSHRMAALKMDSQRDYCNILADSKQECNELIEEVVVPETWFFRNKTPFDALRNYVKQDVLPSLKPSEKIHILSVPCSTGEEPYSIAMALLEEGVDPKRLSIDAIDISKKALAKARRAIYGRNSFRGVDEKITEKYFHKIRSGQHLMEQVRDLVKFRLGNFLIGSLSPHPNYYDIIFCRNLLIYFNRETQQVALEKLYRSLKDTGALFVGHAETANLSRNNFIQYEHPHSFAYVKKVKGLAAKSTKQPSPPGKASNQAPKKIPKAWEQVFQHIAQVPRSSVSGNAPGKVPANRQRQPQKKSILPVKSGRRSIALESAERFVRAGKYDQALKLCEEYLQSVPESADCYFLMGAIYRSSGDDKKSQSMLKKAIYLDPNHEQAIALLLHLAEERGDDAAITSFNRRLQRVRNRTRQ